MKLPLEPHELTTRPDPLPKLDLSGISTYHIGERENLVKFEDLIRPGDPVPAFDHPELPEVAERIIVARRADRPVVCMIGAHMIKCGLSPILIDLMKRRVITHLATNGAGSIHDFEIALIGETSEDVARSIEDGSFGMVEETGRFINAAVQQGVRDGLGYGQSLGRMYDEDDRFRFREYSLFYTGYRLGIPVTVHVTIGTDIIHQHPSVDYGALGQASGRDFLIYCHSLKDLEGGVFLNFGSAVTGPEVFLKALSICRNLGYRLDHITTANFDLVPLPENYRVPVSPHMRDYYYRPWKNIVSRPVSLGGKGFHICGDHKLTLPNLYTMILRSEAEG